jgi:hypothetical protein
LGNCIGADVPDERDSSAKLDGPSKGLKDDGAREAKATMLGWQPAGSIWTTPFRESNPSVANAATSDDGEVATTSRCGVDGEQARSARYASPQSSSPGKPALNARTRDATSSV